MLKLAQAVSMQQTGVFFQGPVTESIINWGQYSSFIPPGQQPTIDKLADMIVSSFAQFSFPPFRNVTVTGHADKDWHGPVKEKKVSFERALAVQKALTKAVLKLWSDRNMGPPPVGGVEWEVHGEGAKHMIAGPYHNANRRVEVSLIRSGGLVPPPHHEPVPRADFHPGANHGHAPSGRWSEVQANLNSPGAFPHVLLACKTMQPGDVLVAAIATVFDDKPIARDHINWYLHTGLGRDFVEDANIKAMLERDTGVQKLIAKRIPPGRTSGKFAGHLIISQDDYTDEDFRNAFGSIDRLDFEVDFDARNIRVWFKDRYEFHPYYPGIYEVKNNDADVRPNNCVHAAAVELKSSGAADFWMIGVATVPLNLIVAK
jgi:hypothetical protein